MIRSKTFLIFNLHNVRGNVQQRKSKHSALHHISSSRNFTTKVHTSQFVQCHQGRRITCRGYYLHLLLQPPETLISNYICEDGAITCRNSSDFSHCTAARLCLPSPWPHETDEESNNDSSRLSSTRREKKLS